MKRMAAILGVLVLAGCGGSSGGTVSGAEKASDVATKIGCTGLVPEPSPQLYVADQATCSLNGVDVRVYSFASDQDVDNWWKIAQSFGVANMIRSGRVIVDAINQDTAAKVKAALG